MIAAVLPVYIINDLSPAVHAEIDIDIRHADPVRVEEALEIEVVFHRVHVGDLQSVAHHAPGGAAPAGAHGDALGFGVMDEIADDEEVFVEAHVVDGLQLEIQLAFELRGPGSVPLRQPRLAEPAEIGLRARFPFGQAEFRQMVFPEGEFQIAALRDPGGIVRRLRPLGEEGAHLLLGFDVEFFRLEAHPVLVLHGLLGLDAEQHVLDLRVLLRQIVGVVGDYQGEARFPVEAQDALVHALLLRQAVVLELQVKVLRAEHGAQLQGRRLRCGIVLLPQQTGDLPGQAGGEGDQPLRVLPQQSLVDPGLEVEAVDEGPGHQIAEVPVAGLVFAEQHQMPGLVVDAVLPVLHAPGGHIDLAADDGLDPGRLGGLVEGDGPVHDPVVRDGHRLLAQLLEALHQPFDAAGAVQQAVFTVYVQMNE